MARAYNQAQKFGAEIAIPDEAHEAGRGETARAFASAWAMARWCGASSLVLASGARYRRLDIANLSDFEGTCVHYWASADRNAGSAPARRWRWSGRAIRRARRWSILAGKVEEALDDRARREPGSHHVAISDRPHPRPAQCRSADCAPRSAAWRARTARCKRVRWKNRDTGAESSRAIGHVFSFHRRRTQHRLAGGLRHRAGRQGFCRHRRGRQPSAGHQPRRRFRRGRCALRLGQAGGGGGGRGLARWCRRIHAFLADASAQADRKRQARSDGDDLCSHLDTIRKVTPSALGLRGMPEAGLGMVSPARLPHLRPCRLLRPVARQARHQAFPPQPASHHRRL